LTGISADHLVIIPETIPSTSSIALAEDVLHAGFPEGPGILAAEATAKAKQEHARGDAQYTWRPQIIFTAQYGRISPINNVSEFYNLHGNYNTATAGIQIQLPLVDKVRKAAAEISSIDAARAEADLQTLRQEQSEDMVRLHRSISELSTEAELADLDLDIAQDELEAIIIQLHASPGGPPLTPKEELGARIKESQRYLDLLNAKAQLFAAEVSLLRQTGGLAKWIQTLPIVAEPNPARP
jgi:outer membrane protein TolC